ncbi:MAG: PilC/PilY family type IV pilus protein [Usitatibacter sp.]
MKPTTLSFRLTTLLAALAMGAATGASAALTDISQSPLASAASNLVKPNISYVLDTSGSMAWTHAPDESQPWAGKVGYKTPQCNSIYYNPNIIYPPARNFDGTQMANSSFTAAPKDGFSAYDNVTVSTVNLSTSFYAYDNTTSFGAGTDTAQPAYYYVYTGSQQPTGLNYQNSSSAFYKECNSAEPKNGPTATITFAGSSLTLVNQISVNGVNIMSGATGSTTSPTTLASSTAANITLNGFSATSSSGVVTITGPASAQVSGVSPVITATPPFQNATLTFSGTKNTAVTGITVNGVQIMTGTAGPSTSSSTLAAAVAGAVGLNGYSATASGSVVTLQGPNPGSGGFTAVVTMKGNQSATLTFSGTGNTAATQVNVGGSNIMNSATAVFSTSSGIATAVAPKITLGGFAATASGSAVTITGGPLAAGLTPVATLINGAQTSTVTFSGSGNTIVSSITVNGTNVMSSSSSAAAGCSTVAGNAAAAITGGGYSAFSSGCTVTITGPASVNGVTPVVTTGPGNSTGSITFSGTSSTSLSQIKINGVSIMSGSTTASTACASVAFAVASKITLNGYTATASSCTVNINGPASGIGFTPVITKTGSMTASTAALTGPTPASASASAFAGASAMTSSGTAFIDGGVGTMAVAATPFAPPGIMTATIVPFSPFFRVLVGATSGPGGTDERTNFANWFTYYRVRILMMKSGLGRAFVSIGNNYRVGFMTIYATPGTSSLPDYLPIADFNTGTGTATSCTSPQKCAWFNAVYTQTPGGGTPLKVALSTAARNLAGKIGPDPYQYSCQQNFILLSTDGYWNSGTPSGVQMNGSTAIANEDNNLATAPRPQYDGALTGSTGTLADVAWYYYNTDMRPTGGTCNTGVSGADVCQDNVPVSGLDSAPWQHATLFTLGLGTNGQLVYTTDYLTGGSADFNAIVSGSKNWPTPVGDQLTTIDDLWHAAVNGHGQYFSAKNPDLLVAGLNTALAGVSARLAAGAAAATSNLEPVAGDNFAFVASYTTQEWSGDLQSRTINLTTGAISSTPNWSAQANLDLAATDVSDTRTIFTNLGTGSSPVLTQFVPGSFNSTQKSNWFTPANAPQLSQYASWSVLQQTAGTADTVINYLRGQWGFEERGVNIATNQLYRTRTHVLGDIIDGKPVYMRLPPFNYAENNYAAFKTSSTVTSRTGTVYVGGNDGMLHAFDSTTGNEIWAYIPSFVLPNLKALADDTYPGNHKYFVDGSPVVTDIWNGSAWKTVLVGGLGAGGKGYFALDVTDPANPNILWEYSDANLGYSFGNPVVGKLSDGTWVAAFTSGYNNVGDGVGRLYVVNAWTGVQKFTVSTGVGSATSPSGLNKISAWVDNGLLDNTIQRIYGGDQFGNLWRFDINNQYPPSGIDALQLAYFQVGTYQQPITTQPELGLVNGQPMIYVGTGRYLGATDLSDLNQQSLYAIADKLTGTGIGNARTETTCPLVQQSLTVVNVNTRTTTTLPVDLTTKCGWFLDFNPTGGNTPGERVNVDPKLQLGVLAVATNIPLNDVCSVGGTSFLYFFDYRTGQFVSTSTNNVAGSRIGNAIAVGVNTYQLPSGQVVSTVTTSDDQHPTFGNPSNPSAVPTGRRVMWRELLN